MTDSIEDNTENPADPQEEEKSYKQARVWLQPGQRQKQNLNRGNLLASQLYHYVKEDGLILSHQNKILPRTISRRKSLIFFDTIRRYNEKKMEQLNFARSKFHLRDHLTSKELVR